MTQPLRDPSGPALVRWTIRLTDAEAKLIERWAKRLEQSKADFMRELAMREAQRLEDLQWIGDTQLRKSVTARRRLRKKPHKKSTR